MNVVKKSAQELFGVPLKPNGDITLRVFENQPHVPELKKDYVFRSDRLRQVLLWLSGRASRNIFLSGPSGAGKTSLLEQVCARTGRSMIRVGCYPDMEVLDLVGRWVVKGQDKWEYNYGPLPLAMKYGYVLLLDEADTLTPRTAMGLNSILDGAPLYIPETNETITPHENFFVAATGNTNGQGDPTGNFRGTTKQNQAYADRFLLTHVAYLTSQEEEALLEKAAPNIPAIYRQKAVKYANDVRAPYMSPDFVGVKPSITLTTRGLIRWMHSFEMLRNLGSADPLLEALNLTLINKGTPADQVFFQETYKALGVGNASAASATF